MLPARYPETKGLNINTYPRACNTCICNPLNLGILKIGVLACNEILKFLTYALIAPSPSIMRTRLALISKMTSYNDVCAMQHNAGRVPHIIIVCKY